MMNIRQIEDQLIHAERVTIETKAARVGPKPLKAMALPYLHSRADLNGWGNNPGDRRSRELKVDACRLRPEDRNPFATISKEFWDQFDEDPSESEIEEAQTFSGLIYLVDDPDNRRALLAWAYAMAGGRPFKRWCLANGFTPQTGRRRKTRAIEQILAKLESKSNLHDENASEGVLPVAPEIDHLSATFNDDAGHETGPTSWAANDAFQPFSIERIEFGTGGVLRLIPTDQSEFTWAKRRCELRRQREAKRRKQEEAAKRKVEEREEEG